MLTSKVLDYIRTVSPSVPVHLELASVAKDIFLKEILDIVGANVNSIGLNELELAHVYHVLADIGKEKGSCFVFFPCNQNQIFPSSRNLVWLW